MNTRYQTLNLKRVQNTAQLVLGRHQRNCGDGVPKHVTFWFDKAVKHNLSFCLSALIISMENYPNLQCILAESFYDDN